MRKPVCVVVLTVLAVVFAGSPVTYSQAAPKIYRWEATNPSCTNYKDDDALVTSIDTPEAHLTVILIPTARAKDLQKYFVFVLLLSNKGPSNLNVEPGQITVDVLGKKPTTLSALPLAQVADKIEKYGTQRFFIGFRPTLPAYATVTDSQGNVSTVDARVPNTAAEAAANRANAERQAKQQSRASDTYSLGLKANTVFKDQVVKGVVFFDKKKALSDDGLILNIPLGAITFQVPLAHRASLSAQRRAQRRLTAHMSPTSQTRLFRGRPPKALTMTISPRISSEAGL